MFRSQIEQVRRTSSKRFEEAAEKALDAQKTTAAKGVDAVRRAILSNESLESFGAPPEARESQFVTEAIILSELRPAYFVLDGGIELNNEIVGDPDLVKLITDNKAALETVCASVGRVDLINHWTLPYGGTGFLIADDIAVTNRHVARIFGEAIWNGFRFQRGRFGQPMEARLDYCHLWQSTAQKRAEVEDILYIAKDNEPDFALLKVRKLDDIAPLSLAEEVVRQGQAVAVVGYPAEDGERNEKELMDRLFGGVYQVKRLAPGFVTSLDGDRITITSDYTSLGGNSGSPLIALDSGKVVALHFAGRFMENNYALSADVLAAARREVVAPRVTVSAPVETPVTKAADLRGRRGYDPEFLGKGAMRVDLPKLGAWASDIAPVAGADDGVLRYEHFSCVQSVSRRLPLVTAVNIDGAASIRLKRDGAWKLDGRLDKKHQVGEALYIGTEFDRGHMVRRRDPGWGDTAQEGELDTFHYTNSVPQHRNLNRKEWVGLEDYVLEAAETDGFRVSVFTGPVFRDTDKHEIDGPAGGEDVPIPEEFWKIAVIVNAETGKLSATGYVLSHGPLIRDLVESPFVYGSYKTYQVQIAKIEAETGLDFGTLSDFDPLGAEIDSEAPFAQVARAVEGPESLVLSRPVTA